MARWDSAVVEIAAGSYREFDVLSGKANMFFAMNHSGQDIYISMGNVPRMDSYEKVLKRNSGDAFGRPTPVNRVYFLNLSAEAVSVTLYYTWTEDFDFGLMKDFSITLDGNVSVAAFDGIIKGVQTGVSMPVSLPSAFNTTVNNIYSNGSAVKTNTGNIDSKMAAAVGYLENMVSIMQNTAETNAVILEGINALLQEAL